MRNTIINYIIVSLIIRPDILQLQIINENIIHDIPLNGKLLEVNNSVIGRPRRRSKPMLSSEKTCFY